MKKKQVFGNGCGFWERLRERLRKRPKWSFSPILRQTRKTSPKNTRKRVATRRNSKFARQVGRFMKP